MEQEAPVKKKKKHHVGLWITLIVIFVLVILPVGLAFALFFDPTHKSEEQLGINTTGKAQSVTKNLVVDMFDNTDNADMNNPIMISITEQDVNQALYDGILSKLDANAKSFIPGVYLEVNEDNYTFTVELNAYGFFKTRLMLVTGLSLSDNPKGLMFEIKNIKVARLGGVQNISINILKNFLNDADLTKQIQQGTNFGIESHLFDNSEKHYLFYPQTRFIEDMRNMIAIDQSVAFFQDFLIDMISQRKLTFDFYSNKAVNGSLSLKDYHNNPTYCSYNDYVIDFNNKELLNRYLPSLLKEGKVNEQSVDAVSKFLSYGYTQLDESEKTFIDSQDYLPTTLGKSLADYSADRELKFASKGAALKDVQQVEDIVSKQVSDSLTPTRIAEIIAANGGKVSDIAIDEIQLHDVLKTNPIVGFGKTFYRPTIDGGYKVSFITLDNIYLNIVNNNIYFIIGLNINGYEISLVLSSIIQSGGNGKLNFKLDSNNIYLGNEKLSPSLFSSLSTMLGEAIGDSGWFSYDGTTNSFVVDFSKAIEENSEIKILKASGLNINIGVSALGSAISDNGHIEVSVSASKS